MLEISVVCKYGAFSISSRGEEQPSEGKEKSDMAMTRKFLKALGIEEDKIEQIIEAHDETVSALKADRDKFKADAEKLPEVQRELDTAKATAKNSGDAAKIQKDFDDFKAEVQAKEIRAKKETALRKVAKDAGLTEAGITKALKYSDYAAIELDDKDEIKAANDLIKSLKEEWSEHLSHENTNGANTPTPPGGFGGGSNGGNSRAAALYNQHYAALYGQKNTAGKEDK